MKKIFFILLIVVPAICFSQDSTVITNLQLKAGTIRVIAGQTMVSGDTSITRVFFKWGAQFKPIPPNDNANVTIDLCPTIIVAWIYERLLSLPGGYLDTYDYKTDFRTSILSKRNTNSFLDRLCDNLEARFGGEITGIMSGSTTVLTQ